MKNVIHKYVKNGSCVFACFLDASKAFDKQKRTDVVIVNQAIYDIAMQF